MKKTYVLASLLLLAPVVVLAQEEEKKIEGSGEVTVGVRQGTGDDSSKFNKNRDIDDGFYLDSLWFGVLDPQAGRYLDFSGQDLLQDDQSLRFGFGGYGSWGVVIDRNEIPHNLSNKAKTPYIDQGNGLLTLPSTAAIPNPDLVPSAAQLTANDAATAAWLADTLHNIELGTQRDKTSATLSLIPGPGDFRFRLSLSDERKDGSNLTYGPIGDRPPRTLNAQLAEPIDYTTQELKFEAEYIQPTWQAMFTYLLSGFENDIDTLRWQNPYVADADGSGYDVWDAAHNVASFGQRALAPDNRYQNVSLALGFDLPMASRLNANVAYGMMEQDETLLPYSTTDFGSATAFGSTAELPRTNADTEIDTLLFNADYSINPIDRLNLRAFVRYYDLDNKTPQSQWWYVTDDTITATNATNGETTELNKRVNLAYSYDQMNYGLETAYSFTPGRTTVGLGYEREEIDRDFREANTEENIFKASVKARPTDWVTLRAKYLYGDRDGSTYYNNAATNFNYWGVAPTSSENPVNSFNNHPDMRRFDVSDRERDQFDLAATIMPTETVDFTASYRYQKDDYDSGVTATQPLLASGNGEDPADDVAITPGDQLGLLERETQRYALDASYAPTDRLTLSAFGAREIIESTQRGLEFNEGNKLDPTDIAATNDLGPWTRETSQWMAVTDDKTNTIGLGIGYEIIPGKLRLATDYSYSQGKVDIEYSGFGTISSANPSVTLADNTQYAFRSPETVTHKQYNLNATLEYQFVKSLVLGLHYIYDRYKISDWMQEADTPWYESVGSEYLLRDTSDATSTQWGNRLINLGSYLGPSYEAHYSAITLTYRY